MNSKDMYDLTSEKYLASGDIDRLIADLEKRARSQW